MNMGTLQELRRDIDKLEMMIAELKRYLESEKFNHPNHWVNVDDVLERLRVSN